MRTDADKRVQSSDTRTVRKLPPRDLCAPVGVRPLHVSHIYITGKTGTGKSTLLLSLMLEEQSGFALIDPHGDLARNIADNIPRERRDAIYLDPLHETHAIGFNPLERVPVPRRALAAAGIVSAFKSIWKDSWGPRLEYILHNSVRLLLDVPRATLIHLPLLLANDAYLAKALPYCTDPFIRYFWVYEFAGWSERLKSDAISPVQNKVGQFAANPTLRSILGQSSTLDLDRVLDGQILIANLSKQMGSEPSHLLGALLTTSLLQAAERRATVPESDRRPFTLFVDEFQNFTTETFGTILSEARKWKLRLVIANQFLGQLPPSLQQAVLGNVSKLIVFRTGAEDARLLAAELGIGNDRTLTDTSNFEAWEKHLANGTPTEADLIKTQVPALKGGRLAKVIAHTIAAHGRPKEKIAQEIERLFLTAGNDGGTTKRSARSTRRRTWTS